MPTEQPHETHPGVKEKRLLGDFDIPDYNSWRDEVTRLLKGVPFEKRMLTETHEGITLKPLYTEADTRDLEFAATSPGFAPFVRGFKPVRMGEGWAIAQKINYPTPEEFNQALSYDLDRGQNAVNLHLDWASRNGLDPDAAAAGQVGRDGVSISSYDDMAQALEGINIGDVPVYIHPGAVGLPFLALYLTAAQRANVPAEDLSGAIACDPLGELAETGELPVILDDALADLVAMTVWAADKAPRLGTVWVHGEPYHNGGGNAVTELALVTATAVEYLRQLAARAIPPERAAAHFRFSFAQGTNFFMELAKIRAARLLWNRVQESCGIPENRRTMWLQTETARYNMTIFDPYVNILRLATEAFSGIAGGADSVQVASFDERLKPSGEFSRRVSRNIQIILREEVKLAKVTDPAGGSYYVESLTDEIARAAWGWFQQVEQKGGMIKALQNGFPQEITSAAAKKREKAFSTRKDVLVGSNKYPNPNENYEPVMSLDFVKIQKSRSEKIKRLKVARKDIDRYLSGLTDRKVSISAIVDAVREGATVGEICRARYANKDKKIKVTPIKIRHTAEPLEKLRQAVERSRSGKKNLKVFLATLGPVGQYMARLDFAASFFEVGGFEVERTSGFTTPEKAAEAAIKCKAAVVVICGLDEVYPEQAPVVTARIKKANPATLVVLAGLPTPELAEKLRRAGVDIFIHIKSDILEVLTETASKTGVTL
ncbi:MAG: methylmalonyl-CoA mutase family protein [Candidatus Zixiibacteriota bacterium]